MDDVVEDEIDDRLEVFEENFKNIPDIQKLKSIIKEIWEDGFQSGQADESASYQRDFEDFFNELGDKYIMKISEIY